MRVESTAYNPDTKFGMSNPEKVEVYLDGRRIFNPILFADEEAGEVMYVEAEWRTGQVHHLGPDGKPYTITRKGKVEIKGHAV